MASKLPPIDKIKSTPQTRIPKIQHNKQQNKESNNEYVTDVIKKQNRLVITFQITFTK